MTFLRIAISSFFIVAPVIGYFSGMDPKVLIVMLIAALWGIISVAGEGALGLHHLDAYGPLSPYNDESDSELTATGKVSAGVVALLGAILLFFAASSYISRKDPMPQPTSLPTSTPEASPVPDASPEPVVTPKPVASKTPVAVPTPRPTRTSRPVSTPTPEATPAATPEPDSSPSPEAVATVAPDDPELMRLKDKAEGMVLSRDYKGAMKILVKIEKQSPNDVDILFFRFLALQGLNENAEAQVYAERILKEHPRSRYERRLQKFLASLELAERRAKMGGDTTSYYAVDKTLILELPGEADFTVSSDLNLDEATGLAVGKALLGLGGDKVKLKAGDKVQPLKSVRCLISPSGGAFSWEKSRTTSGYTEADLVFVKVAEGDNKGKQGWLLNNVKGAPAGSEDKPAVRANNVLQLPVIR